MARGTGQAERGRGGGRWLLCCDVGGTFTDAVALEPGWERGRGRVAVRRTKVPSGIGETGEASPVTAARELMGVPSGALPATELRLATTRGTNALLTGDVAPVALIVSRGFGDVLEIGDQRRPDLFDLAVRKAAPLHRWAAEVAGRCDAGGRATEAVDEREVERAGRRALAAGCTAAAVCLMHSWANGREEAKAAEVLRGLGFAHVTAAAELSPMIRLLGRARAAVINAALSGPLERFFGAVRAGWAAGRDLEFLLMTSAGGLTPAARFRPIDSVLSGPAGGVLGAGAVAEAMGLERVITLDMGGTSTDVARWERSGGGPRGVVVARSHEVGGARVELPAVAVESVAAGGGSICRARGPLLTVGPESAGAKPGPASYGRGGPLAVTDVDLLAGRLDERAFNRPLDVGAAEAALAVVVGGAGGGSTAAAERAALQRLLDEADDRMADAVRALTVRRGHDATTHALMAFGGAGGQHACAVAERLGIDTVVCPADASVLSAVGLLRAQRQERLTQQVLLSVAAFAKAWPGLRRKAEAELKRRMGRLADVAVGEMVAMVRYAGQDATLEVPLGRGNVKAAAVQRRFERAFAEVYGHVLTGRTVEVESVRVTVAGGRRVQVEGAARGSEAVRGSGAVGRGGRGGAARRKRTLLDGRWVSVPVVDRREVGRGGRGGLGGVAGPALVSGERTTVLVPAGWRATATAGGDLLVRRAGAGKAAKAARWGSGSGAEQALAGRINALAGEMGELLGRLALSANVRERLDYSFAILDAQGVLTVSAPHVPVHLGSMGVCVRSVLEPMAIGPGDVVVTNHPAFGGSHLPDVTLIAGAFDDRGRVVGYVACRAHHAEIGGSRPGSMPPAARTLAEEGVVIEPRWLVKAGRERMAEVEGLLRSGVWPSRAPEVNLADLRAQLAAVRLGVRGLEAAADGAGGPGAVARAMAFWQEVADAAMPSARELLGRRSRRAAVRMDDGSRIAVKLSAEGRSGKGKLVVDFAGTSPRHAGNFNATPAIVHSCVLFALRALLAMRGVRWSLPLNEGLMRRVRVESPAGSMLSPEFGGAEAPAVAAGNVEISQRIVQALLGAFGLPASQGTMNNVLFGNDRFGHYETLGGGCGAGPEWAGASAVHSHMTNTAITDAEVLEQRFGVRIERFGVRRGSGGRGRFAGGDGLVRRYRFAAPVSVSVIGQHRTEGPPGAKGGGAGKPGEVVVVRAAGGRVRLGASASVECEAGDVLEVRTPGGGGYGRAASVR